MKLKFTAYEGSPCWRVSASRFWLDADWNTRFPFGASICLRLGPARDGKDYLRPGPGFTIDLNPPLGEPNRLYLWLGRAGLVLGLPTIRGSKPTGEEVNGVPVWRECLTWPRIERPSVMKRRKRDDG